MAALELGLTLWLAVCAVWDWRERRVPNALTIPPLAVALAGRVWCGGWDLLGVLLLGGYALLWYKGVIGGADAKIGLTLTLVASWWGYAALCGVVVLGAVWKMGNWERHTPAVVGMFIGVMFLAAWGLTNAAGVHIIKASAQGALRLFAEPARLGRAFCF